MISQDQKQIRNLIKSGADLLKTYQSNNSGFDTLPTLDQGSFSGWRTRCLSIIERIFSTENVYYINFDKDVAEAYPDCVKSGLSILKYIHQELNEFDIEDAADTGALETIEKICDKFQIVARQLSKRYNKRSTIEIEDEYDVQDLFYALLKLFFDDIRREEFGPSHSGKSPRFDFLLNREEIVLEIKKTRPGVADKQIGTQLIDDIARYRNHPKCKTFIGFIYDPEGRIANPLGLQDDLESIDAPFLKWIFVRPM